VKILETIDADFFPAELRGTPPEDGKSPSSGKFRSERGGQEKDKEEKGEIKGMLKGLNLKVTLSPSHVKEKIMKSPRLIRKDKG
jgi:hypothetical protein